MLRVDLPSTHSTQLPRPVRAIGNIVPAGTVARKALIARPASTLHMQDAGQHEQARFYGTPLDLDIAERRRQLTACCAITWSSNPRHIISEGATDRPLSRRIAAYTFVELTPASLATRQRHRKLPGLQWALGQQFLHGLAPPARPLVSITATCPRAIGCACGHEAV